MKVDLMAKILSFVFIQILWIDGALAQINGIIRDQGNEEVLIGATIRNLSTGEGTISDFEGNFKIGASAGDILQCSFIGYETKEISVGTETNIIIELIQGLIFDEIVVTGYTVDQRRKIIGSVSSVEARDLQIAPSGNIDQQLQGRVAGVTVVTNGQPGTSSQIRVRGYGALGGNEPLYIVDGVPLYSVDFLAPDDIASVSVLKDATAASVYGARAAGGVIVYTTKKGKTEKQGLHVTYDAMVGMSVPNKGPEMLSPQEQAEWTWTAIRNAALQAGITPVFDHQQYGEGASPVLPDYILVGQQYGIRGSIDLADHIDRYNIDPNQGEIYQVVKANKAGTDWYDQVTQNGLINRQHLGFSGAGEKSKFYMGLGMQHQEGIIRHQQMNRYSVRINTEFQLTPSLRVGENIQSTYRSTRLLDGENNGRGAEDNFTIINSYLMNPLIPVYDEFGGYAGTRAQGLGISWGNPLAQLEGLKDNRSFSVQLFGNFYAEWEPAENLVFRSSFGGQYRSDNQRNYVKTSYWGIANRDVAEFSQFAGYSAQWVWTNTLAYKKDFDKHHLDLMFGQEALDEGGGFASIGRGNDPLVEDIDYISLSTVNNRTIEGNQVRGARFYSYFTRVNYDYSDKYYISTILRRDGSSRFGRENRYGYFPAVSVAWRMSSEHFLRDVGFLDDLKLRAGYGIMGNSNNVDPNNQYTLYSTSINNSSYDINGSNITAAEGFYPSRIGNPTAKWEKAVSSNIGIDILLFDGSLDIGMEIWKKQTNDLLFRVPQSALSGFFAEEPFLNVGEIENKGFDFIISYRNLSSDLKYRISLNGSFLDNKITALAPGIDNLPDRSFTYGNITPVLNQVGFPLSSFYGYQVAGIFKNQEEVASAAVQEGAAPGRLRFRDIDENGTIDISDRTFIGNPIPDFTSGINIMLSYGKFELEAYGYAVLGNEIFNLARLRTDFYRSGDAISARIKQSWTPENINASIPIFEDVDNFSTNTQTSSYFVEDGSYFRLQNLTLSYMPALSQSRWGLQDLRLFVSVNNVFTITSYSGLDPGVGGIQDTNFGIDLGNYPVVRNWIFGIKAKF